jgi:hypothetical protein
LRRSEVKAVNLLFSRRQNLIRGLAADLTKEDCEVVGRREHKTSSRKEKGAPSMSYAVINPMQ